MQKLLMPFLLALIIFTLISCNSERNNIAPQESKITGLELRDMAGQPLGNWGNPDIRTTVKSNSCEGLIRLMTYPNPSRYYFTLKIDLACGKNLSYWITKAGKSPNGSLVGGAVVADQLPGGVTRFYAKNEPLSSTSQNFQINVQDLPSGFYRLYVKVDNQLLWNDLYIYRDSKELENIVIL